MSTITALKVGGIVLAAYIFGHFQGLAWGLLGGASLAMIFLT